MPYGYLGQNAPNQTVSNSGVFDISSAADLEKQGKFGGSLELIEEQTFSGVGFVDFTSIKENKYDVHLLQYVVEPTTYERLYCQLYESGVLETASVYQYGDQFGASNGSFSELKSTASTFMYLNYSGIGYQQGYAYFYNLGNSSKYSFLTHQAFVDDTGNSRMHFSFGGGVLPQASTVDGIRVFPQSTSNSFSGTANRYGVKQL